MGVDLFQVLFHMSFFYFFILFIFFYFYFFLSSKINPIFLDTAISKLLKFCNTALDFRHQQELKFGFNGEGCAHAQVISRILVSLIILLISLLVFFFFF